jgi:hypothetical protein
MLGKSRARCARHKSHDGGLLDERCWTSVVCLKLAVRSSHAGARSLNQSDFLNDVVHQTKRVIAAIRKDLKKGGKECTLQTLGDALMCEITCCALAALSPTAFASQMASQLTTLKKYVRSQLAL